ncbi:hypothetical protein HYX00_06640 [Candidatus Woesearchaeota archaeon]|nr:hypothetical protein [Candidatus Woesearchaeota archaeon]
MGLRKDFLVHKRKTVESFRFVRDDIASVNAAIQHLKDAIHSIESRLSVTINEIISLKKGIDKCLLDIEVHNNIKNDIQSKIESINKSIANTIPALSSLGSGIKNVLLRQQGISKSVSIHSSSLKKFQKEINKIKNLLNQKIKTVKRKDAELESKLRNQRKIILNLNKKIGGRRIIKKKLTPKKTIKKIITPKRIVTETTTPTKKTITEIKR